MSIFVVSVSSICQLERCQLVKGVCRSLICTDEFHVLLSEKQILRIFLRDHGYTSHNQMICDWMTVIQPLGHPQSTTYQSTCKRRKMVENHRFHITPTPTLTKSALNKTHSTSRKRTLHVKIESMEAKTIETVMAHSCVPEPTSSIPTSSTSKHKSYQTNKQKRGTTGNKNSEW